MYLKPETNPASILKQLQSTLEALFPQCTDLAAKGADGFTPHLTVGQFVGKIAVERQKEVFKKSYRPIEFQVSHVHVISRTGNDPFVVKHSIPLGQDSTDDSIYSTPQNKSSQLNSADMMEIDIVDEDIKAVVVRCSAWLKKMRDQGKLPKTKRKLLTATTSLCTIQYKTSTVEKVYKTLQVEGYFTENKDKVTYLKPPSHNLRAKRNLMNMSDEEAALERCREWVYVDTNSPGNPAALKHSLDQLLLKKTIVDQQVVFDFLEKKGLISFDADDNVQYKL